MAQHHPQNCLPPLLLHIHNQPLDLFKKAIPRLPTTPNPAPGRIRDQSDRSLAESRQGRRAEGTRGPDTGAAEGQGGEGTAEGGAGEDEREEEGEDQEEGEEE